VVALADQVDAGDTRRLAGVEGEDPEMLLRGSAEGRQQGNNVRQVARRAGCKRLAPTGSSLLV